MKRLRSEKTSLDPVDLRILRALAADARVRLVDLARSVGLSAPSVAERVRRLEESGVIESYAATLDPKALGLPVAAYLRIRPMPGELQTVAGIIQELDAIVECDRVTGEDCFVAKAYLRSVEDLEALIDRIIPHAMTNTSIIQSTPVKRRLPPLGPDGAKPRPRKAKVAAR
jgi:Lrp/AsnC family transcriptional regulator, leucine-responsive regulatory protein